jgi:hypothetical protein
MKLLLFISLMISVLSEEPPVTKEAGWDDNDIVLSGGKWVKAYEPSGNQNAAFIHIQIHLSG